MNILAFGEILWDIFPDKRMIGGAPFNFSAHLAKLGADVSLVTALGEDALGKEARERLLALGVGDAFVGTTPCLTGVCQVSLNSEGKPSYDLVRGVSYDDIRLTEAARERIKKKRFDALYCGTLACREKVSRDTLSELFSLCRFKHILFDINIRQSYYTPEILREGLNRATILKVSREECGVLERCGLLDIDKAAFCSETDFIGAFCRAVADAYGIDTVLFTLDKDGAAVFQGGVLYFSEKPQSEAVSAVGAGDSFSAAYLYFLQKGEPVPECLKKAVVLSDFVVGHLEAIPAYSDELKTALGIYNAL